MNLKRAICFSPLLMLGMLLMIRGQTPVLTNRTPDAAKITPTPNPTSRPSQTSGATLIPDPVLSRGEGSKPILEALPDFAYFVCLRNVSRVLVSDSRGRTDDLFERRSIQTISSASYDVARDAVYIIVPVKETYSITFETNEPVMGLEILKGRTDSSPDEAIRYRDLVLDGKRAKFDLTSAGIGQLRVDASQSGRFESLIEPTVNLHGQAAHDTTRPAVTIQILERNGDTALISIKAEDAESGVKRVSYALDNFSVSHGGYQTFPYQGPLRIDLKQTKVLWAFAEDYAANRSGAMYDFRK